MNKKQIRKVINKNVKIAAKKGKIVKKAAIKKGSELSAIAKNGYKQLKKDMKISPAEAKRLEAKAIKEYKKVKKQVTATTKKAGAYIKKNPRKVAAISVGIGAALAGAAAMLISSSKKKKSGKKRK